MRVHTECSYITETQYETVQNGAKFILYRNATSSIFPNQLNLEHQNRSDPFLLRYFLYADHSLQSIYSGSGVLFVLKRVFVSFYVSFSLRFVFVAFRTFLTKNAFYVSPIP